LQRTAKCPKETMVHVTVVDDVHYSSPVFDLYLAMTMTIT